MCGHVHVDSVSTHAPPGAIIVPDAHLLFTGDFKRSGVDLVLSGDDRELVLHDYFKGEKRATLEVQLPGGTVRLCAQAKGAGMMQPNFATMLCFVETDAALSAETAELLLGHEAVQPLLAVAEHELRRADR